MLKSDAGQLRLRRSTADLTMDCAAAQKAWSHCAEALSQGFCLWQVEGSWSTPLSANHVLEQHVSPALTAS